MAVFKKSDGIYETHHFDVDPNKHRIQIRETWLREGSQIFGGTYRLSDSELTLDGTWRDVGKIAVPCSYGGARDKVTAWAKSQGEPSAHAPKFFLWPPQR